MVRERSQTLKNILYVFIYIKLKISESESTVVEVSQTLVGLGDVGHDWKVHEGASEGLIMFCFLIRVLASWVCSVCEIL